MPPNYEGRDRAMYSNSGDTERWRERFDQFAQYNHLNSITKAFETNNISHFTHFFRYGDHKRERFDSYNRGTSHNYHNRDRDHRDRDRDRDRRGIDKRR